MIFDTHAHYDDEAFDEDRGILLSSMKSSGIGNIVNIGADMKSSQVSIELANEYDFIYAAVGVHPSEVEELTDEHMDELEKWAALDKVVAIGEIGLDYHYPDTDKALQKKWFVKQLEVAAKAKLPVVIHSRDAAKDTLDIMKEHKADEIGGVVHCYSYGVEMAREYLDMGYYFGIGGVVTFTNSKKLKEVVSYLPLDKIVLETDCPYLSPVPNRGKRNSSLNLPYVVSAIADIKQISEEEVIEATTKNAFDLYRIK